jgi:hypothetical protein
MRLTMLALLGCVSSAALHASNVSVGNCTAEPLSVYLTSSGLCEIGYYLFGGFYYLGTSLGSGTALPATDIMVTPIMSSAGPGLEFSANWTGSNNGGSDSEIGYHMSTVSGLPTIDAATMSFTAAVSGTADARLDEYLCPGGDFTGLCSTDPGDVLHMYLELGPNAGPPTTSLTFDGVNNISLLKDVRTYGAGTGVATISEVTNQFPVPEPVTPSLCLAGLLAMWGFRRYRASV